MELGCIDHNYKLFACIDESDKYFPRLQSSRGNYVRIFDVVLQAGMYSVAVTIVATDRRTFFSDLSSALSNFNFLYILDGHDG